MAKPITDFGSNLGTTIAETVSSFTETGSLLDASVRAFYEEMENQLINQFQVIIVPNANVIKNLLVDPFSVLSLITLAENANIGKFYIQNISTPMLTYEYTRVSNKQYVTDVIYPDEISMTFLENDLSTVQRYLSHWQDEIYQTNSIDILGAVKVARGLIQGLLGSIDADSALQQKFKSDPGLAKKDAYVIPLKKDGSSALVWFVLEGLSFKSASPIEWAQDSGDPLKIEATFSVDNTRFIKPI